MTIKHLINWENNSKNDITSNNFNKTLYNFYNKSCEKMKKYDLYDVGIGKCSDIMYSDVIYDGEKENWH